MDNTFLTAGREVEIKNKVKDSKFFGNITSGDSKKNIKKFINKIKDKYNDASHNVSAYKLGTGDQAVKYADDDGEPSGSSGPPVLKAIEGEKMTNTVIVVTRYFGGTELGIGGLIRAYGETARLAINKAGLKKLSLIYKLKVKGKYSLTGDIMGQIEAFSGKILSSEYGNDSVEIKFLLNPEKYHQFKDKLISLSGNKIKINKVDQFYVEK